MKRILLIGGYGMLGRPVARRLAEAGFPLVAFARRPEAARELLPEGTEVIEGDLRNPESIRRAADGVDAVYINLATENHRAGFRTELDGTKNVLKALGGRREVLVAKLSTLRCQRTGWWLDMDQKFEAEEAIRSSGHPYLIFRPSWFYESLPLFVRKGTLIRFGPDFLPLYWIAGDDYARQVTEAFRQGRRDRVYEVQGPEPLGFDEAARRFIAAYDPSIRLRHMPLWPMRLAAMFQPQFHTLVQLSDWCSTHREENWSEETWADLGRPEMTVEDYAEYIKATGDWPSK